MRNVDFMRGKWGGGFVPGSIIELLCCRQLLVGSFFFAFLFS